MEKDKFVDFNIEYAHIYSDECFGKEQIASIEKTIEIIKDLEKNNKTYSLVALIDDYHPDKNNFDKNKFVNNLRSHGLNPDYVASEAGLVKYKQDILNSLPHKKAKKEKKYLEKREKINCSFLISCWYLLRLGLLPLKGGILVKISKRKVPPYGREIINILNGKYTHSEDHALKIIEKSSFGPNIYKIKNIFYTY